MSSRAPCSCFICEILLSDLRATSPMQLTGGGCSKINQFLAPVISQNTQKIPNYHFLAVKIAQIPNKTMHKLFIIHPVFAEHVRAGLKKYYCKKAPISMPCGCVRVERAHAAQCALTPARTARSSRSSKTMHGLYKSINRVIAIARITRLIGL